MFTIRGVVLLLVPRRHGALGSKGLPSGCHGRGSWLGGVLVLALLATASAQSPPLDRASGFEFSLPRGWTRRTDAATKATTLTLPGAEALRIALHPVVKGGAEPEVHESTFQSLVKGAENEPDALTGRTAGFRWSLAYVVRGGALHRAIVYTTTSGAAVAAVSMTGPASLFDQCTPALEQFLWDLKVEGAPSCFQDLHGLSLPVPSGWTRTDDPMGACTLEPPARERNRDVHFQYIVMVLPPQPLQGTLWETHRMVFDEMVKGLKLTGTTAPVQEPDAPGPFIRSATAGNDARNSLRVVRLYSALSEAGLHCVVTYGQEDFAATGAMLQRARVRKPLPDASRPKLVECYRRLSQQAHAEAVRGDLMITAVPYDRLWLRDDGTADFSPLYPEGFGASRLAGKVDRSLQNGRFGSWQAVGDQEVHVVRRTGQPAEVYVRENGRLRLGDKVFEPMPSVDGLKLDGRWHYPGDPQRRIEFTAAGRFQDEGALEDVETHLVPAYAGSRDALRPRPPARGTGTYAIRDFTLFVTYDDGFVWSTDFSTCGADSTDLSKLLLKTGVLHRVP